MKQKQLLAIGLSVAIMSMPFLNVQAAQPEEEALLAQTEVVINETNFPDANFRQYILDEIDKDGNGSLSEGEIENQVTINVSEKNNIASLKGVEYFSSLVNLYCSRNQLTELDLSKNIFLENLDCSINQLTVLDVSKNTSLKWLDCTWNQLTELDLSKNTFLENLDCYNNKLTNLNVSNNTYLQCLSCGNNQLTVLDVSKNVAMDRMFCFNNQLTYLNITHNTLLKYLGCSNNQLTNLNISKNIYLEGLECRGNRLTSLDVSKNTKLKDLGCDGNYLMELDLSNCTQLTAFISEALEYDQSVKNLNNQFDTKSISQFDGTRVSDLDNVKFENGVFTIQDTSKVGSYVYNCGMGHSMKVKLSIGESSNPVVDSTSPFNDVSSNDWYYNAVNYAYTNSIMNGVGNNQFNPTGNTTRAMVVQILYNVTGKPAMSGSNNFTDVSDSAWYVNAVKWAAQSNVTSGVSANIFAPDKDVTRQEVASFLYRYANLKGYDTSGRNDLSSFGDSDQVSGWALEAMQWANNAKIINGKGNGMLDPQGKASRAEIATMMKGFMERYQ